MNVPFTVDQCASVLSNTQLTADFATDLSMLLMTSANICCYKCPRILGVYLQEAGSSVWSGTAAAIQAAAL